MVKRFNNYDSQLEDAKSAVALTNEAKLSLYKKSQKSGISTDILEEVYRRGHNTWSEVFGGTPEQFAFDRVNSFISGGFAAELDEDLRKWFNPKHPEGGWKRINSKGEVIGPCAREPGEPKPKCMSNEKRAKLSKKERAAAVAAKRRYDPVADRSGKGGKPVNVSNFGKGKISEDYLEEKNTPTNPSLWSKAKSLARSKFDVYPSAYANGWAAKWYKSKGGGWKSVSEESIEEACWDTHKQVGWKKKGNRTVPDCVPKEETEELNKPVMTPGQLAKKHGKPVEVIKKAIQKGINVEKEHTTHSADAKRIALAHIGEKPDYYTKLDKAGLEEEKRQEAHSKNPVKSASRFDGSDELVNIYKSTTPGQTVKTIKKVVSEVAAWQRKEGKDPKGGLNRKGVESYRRENPGSQLQMAVTTPPSKLDPDSKAAKRRKSFCARMGGAKGPMKDEKGRPTRKALALRKWNCEETEVAGFTGKRIKVKNVPIRMADGSIRSLPPGKSGSSGGGGDEE